MINLKMSHSLFSFSLFSVMASTHVPLVLSLSPSFIQHQLLSQLFILSRYKVGSWDVPLHQKKGCASRVGHHIYMNKCFFLLLFLFFN